MSTWTRIVLTERDRPLVADAVDAFARETFEPGWDLSDQPARIEHPRTVPHRVVLSWDEERWSVDGSQRAARQMSERFECDAEWTEEWDTADADEAGQSGRRYSLGRLTAKGEMTMTWTAVENA